MIVVWRYHLLAQSRCAQKEVVIERWKLPVWRGLHLMQSFAVAEIVVATKKVVDVVAEFAVVAAHEIV